MWDVNYVRNMLPDFEEYDSIPKNKREDVIEKVATAMRAIEHNTNLFN